MPANTPPSNTLPSNTKSSNTLPSNSALEKTFPILTAVLLIACSLPAAPLGAQDNEQWRAWNQPIEPFQIIDNVYYVGASDIASYLITTPDGHILLDGGFEETAPIIRDSIAKLGFELADVEILLNSHAHTDHAGGLAELKVAADARLLAAEADVFLIEGGGKGDPVFGDSLTFPPVEVDQHLADGDQVTLGDTTLTAHLTPGHTPGCTTWTMQVEEAGQTRNVVFACSTSILPDVRLTEDPTYPGIADDYARTFEVLKALPCDVFLAAHASFFDLAGKREVQSQQPDGNPFIDPDGYRAWVERGEKRYRERLAEESGHDDP